MRGRILPGLPVAAAAGLLVFSCRQLVGIEDQPPGAGNVTPDSSTDAPATCGGFPWTDGACSACMGDQCCAEATACRGDTACAPEFDCIAKCAGNDDRCRTACVTYIDDALVALWSCQARACNSECTLDCGGGLTWTTVATQADAGAACVTCLRSPGACALLTQFAACPDCLSLQTCLDGCSIDETCRLNCFGQFQSLFAPDAGVAAYSAEGNFFCPGVCPTGAYWGCLGNVVWPAGPAKTVMYGLKVLDPNNAGIVDATVEVCGAVDATCASPLSTTSTDVNGETTLTLPAPFTGYLRVTATGYVVTLLSVFPDIYESTAPGVFFQLSPVPESQWTMLAAAVGIPFVPSYGVVYSTENDCAGWPAPGISFSGTNLGPISRPYYEVNGVPSGQATETSYSTGLIGGGFINVAPGNITITASLGSVEVSTVSAVVQANALTVISQVPTH